jgi:2-polyprenyl-3-methyl-5-hydroxy-6-metoxy-1,4-benzoquinol methylase
MNHLEMRIDQYSAEDFERYVGSDRPGMLSHIPATATRVLDVGCALGDFGQRLKVERAIEVWGVEINEYAAAIASKRLDKVLCGAFDSTLNLPKNSFDCITFNDVLEHLIDPYSALTLAQSLLTENGKIVASIPNVRYFDNVWKMLVEKDWQYEDQGILDRTHLRFFTQKSIVKTLNDLGYSIDLIEGVDSIDHVHPHHAKRFRWINRILLKQIEDMRFLRFAVVASPQKRTVTG